MEENLSDGFELIKNLGKCILIELIITFLGMLILAVILTNTNISDTIMGNCIIGISAFAIGIGGFLASRKLKMKGILCGGLQGLIYMIILYMISSISSGNFSLQLEGIVMIVIRYYFWSNWWNH